MVGFHLVIECPTFKDVLLKLKTRVHWRVFVLMWRENKQKLKHQFSYS